MMNMLGLSALHTVAAVLSAASGTEAFSSIPSPIARPPQHHTSEVASDATTRMLLQRDVEGRHFQLEELEDAESTNTDVLLNSDKSITLGGTDGPLYVESRGTWSESCEYLHDDQSQPENFQRQFQMKLTRRFAAGAEGGDGTEIGEFEYDVERTYRGECILVGGNVFAMDGEILDVDEIFGERRVGFFNMIDTTLEREENCMEE